MNIVVKIVTLYLRSPNWPGIFSSCSSLTSGARWPRSLVITNLQPITDQYYESQPITAQYWVITNQRSAILMGVVRQAVNRSAAASSGFIGSSWSLLHAASWMQFLEHK